jgi:hypothetical protein
MELTSLVSRETLLEAVFLCIIPLRAALLKADMDSFKALFAPSALLSVTAFSTFLERVLSMFLTDLFFTVRGTLCRALLMADWLFLGAAFAGNVIPPSYNLHSL